MAHLEDPRARRAEEPGDTRVAAGARRSWRAVAVPGLLVVATVAAWEAAAREGWLPALLLPAPSTIAATLASLVASGELIGETAATVSRVFIGLVLGGVPGALAGLAMGWSRRARTVGDPLVAALHPIPKIAVLPLIMVLFGIGDASKVVVIAVSAFFPMLIGAMEGVRQISPIHFEVARNCGASPAKVLARVVLPGSLPMLLAGARLALNTALLLAIAVELVLTKNGLGAMIWMAWQTLRVDRLYAALVAIAALGVAFNAILQRLSSALVPWQEERQV
jgi:ABC-type nitrate/sulfonate/bicarbonate transport system permease component